MKLDKIVENENIDKCDINNIVIGIGSLFKKLCRQDFW